MKITVNNIDHILRSELANNCEMVGYNENPNGAFIVWDTVDNKDSFNRQTNIIDNCIKNGVPIIVFDKYQEMTPDEISFMIRNGVFLWEPALNDRTFFSYQPIWGVIPKDGRFDIPNNTDRTIDLGYKTSLVRKIPTFEKYYKPISDIGNCNVIFVDEFSNDTINKKVSDMGIDIVSGKDCTLEKIKFTFLLGNDRDYSVGYLDPKIFTYLKNGVIPLLPYEHRWYHSIFNDLVVKNENDISYLVKMYDKIAYGLLYELYDNMSKNLPECEVSNVAKRIISFF